MRAAITYETSSFSTDAIKVMSDPPKGRAYRLRRVTFSQEDPDNITHLVLVEGDRSDFVFSTTVPGQQIQSDPAGVAEATIGAQNVNAPVYMDTLVGKSLWVLGFHNSTGVQTIGIAVHYDLVKPSKEEAAELWQR